MTHPTGDALVAHEKAVVEAVAKALFLDRYPDSEKYWPDQVGICELSNAYDYRGYARAAIEAYRKAMKEQG